MNTATNYPSTSDYERKELVNYYIDSGFSEEDAKKKVAKMSNRRVSFIYDTIPEEGEE